MRTTRWAPNIHASGALLFVSLALLPHHIAIAAPPEDTRVAQIEARIARLEARVLQLEQQITNMAAEATSRITLPPRRTVPGDWRSQENWARIKGGMSFDQVTQILGRPTRTDMTFADQGTWYYEGHLDAAGITVSGNIFFCKRRVLLVSPPVW